MKLTSMALTSEDNTTRVRAVSPGHLIARQTELMEFDPNSELVFETPPQDVVSSIAECFEEFTSTFERSRYVDSDSGDSLFLTQSVTSARTARRHRRTNRLESISDNTSENGSEKRCPEEEHIEYEEGSLDRHQHTSSRRRRRIYYIPPKKYIFPFLLKTQKLSIRKHQILENSEIAGFFKCIKKIKKGYVNTESSKLLEFEPSDTSELDEPNCNHEVKVVDKFVFVPSAHKLTKQKWLSQSILEKRIKKAKGSKNIKKAGTKLKNTKDLPQTKKQSKKKCKKMISKDAATSSVCSLESPGVSLPMELEKQQTQNEVEFEVLAACSDAELSDSACSGPRLTEHVFHSGGEASGGGHVWVIEETQRLNSEEAASEAVQEDVRAGADSSSSSPPQGGDISTQNATRYHGRDFGSQDLFVPLDLQEDENSQTPIDTATSVTHKSETSGTCVKSFLIKDNRSLKKPMAEIRFETLLPDEDQEESESMSIKAGAKPVDTLTLMEDSDVTHIDTDCESVSIFGPGTPRQKGKSHACEEAANKMAERPTRSISTSPDSHSLLLRGEQEENDNELCVSNSPTNTLRTFYSVEVVNSKKCSVCQDTTQSSAFDAHVESLPDEGNEVIKCQKKKRKKTTLPSKDIEVANGEETTVMQSASEPKKRLKRALETGDSPLFTHAGPSFLKRKRRKEKVTTDKGSNSLQCDTDVSSACHDDVITGHKTTHKDERESCEVEDNGSHKEQMAASVLQSSDTSVGISEVKKKKILKQKLKEQEDAELGSDTQNVQDSESLSKKTKQKRKLKEMTRTMCDQDSNTTISQSNGNLERSADRPQKSRVNDLIQATEIGQDDISGFKETAEPLEETCSLVVSDSTVIKVKKKEKKKQKLKEQEDAELGSDTQNVQDSESLSKRTKKKRKFKEMTKAMCDQDSNTTISQSNGNLESSADRPQKSRVNELIQATEIGQDDFSGLIETAEPLEETCNLVVSDSTVIKVKKKEKKKQKLKEQEDAELGSDTQNVQDNESLSKRTKKKRKFKEMTRTMCDQDSNTTFSQSNGNLESSADRPRKSRVKDLIQASEIGQDDFSGLNEAAEPLEETCSLVVSDSTVIKVKKKKKQKLKEQEDAELGSDTQNVQDSESQSKRTKKKRKFKEMTRTMCDQDSNTTISQSNGNLESSADRPQKSRVNDLIQATEIGQDDFSGLNEAAEPLEETCNFVVSDSTVIKVKKKKKQKLKEQEDAELGSDTQNVQDNESLSKRTKKKRKLKEMTKAMCDQDSNTTISQSNGNLESSADRPQKSRVKDLIQASEIGQDDFSGLNEAAEPLEETCSLVVSDSTVIKVKKKEKKKQKLKEQEDAELGSDTQNVQDSESQSKRTKKKRKFKEMTRAMCDQDNNTTISQSNGNLESSADRPQKSRVKDLIQATEIGQDDFSGLNETAKPLEETCNFVVSDSTVIKVKKKKKQKLKEQEDAELGSDTQNVQDSESQSKRTKKKRKFKEMTRTMCDQENNTTISLLNGNLESSADRPRKSRVKDLIQATEIGQDDISGLNETAEPLEETCQLVVSDSTVIKVKKKKKQKLKEPEDAELGSDTQNVQDSESQSKRTKKKRKLKEMTKAMCDQDSNTTISQSNGNLESSADRPQKSRVKDLIQATEIGQDDFSGLNETAKPLEETCHLVVSDSTVIKVKKKKKQKLKEQEDAELGSDTQNVQDSESQSKRTKKKRKFKEMTKAMCDQDSNTTISQSNGNLESSADRPQKSRVNELIQATGIGQDDFSGLNETAEPLEKTCHLVVSDSTVIKVKKKKKQKLKEPEDAELGSDSHSVENDNGSQTTVLCSRKTKKRKVKATERTICDEENNATIRPLSEILEHIAESPVELRVNDLIHLSEATEIPQPENKEKSEEITRCSSPSVTVLKSGKKKKWRRKDESEKHQYDYADVTPDVSLFDEVTGVDFHRKKMGQPHKRFLKNSQVLYLRNRKSNKEAKLNDAKHKKKRKGNNSDLSCAVRPEETNT